MAAAMGEGLHIGGMVGGGLLHRCRFFFVCYYRRRPLVDKCKGVRNPCGIEALQRAGLRVTATAHTSGIGMFSSHFCIFVLFFATVGLAEASEEATLPVHGCIPQVDLQNFEFGMRS